MPLPDNFETTTLETLLVLEATDVKSILRIFFSFLWILFSSCGLSSCIRLSSLCPAVIPHAGHPFPAAIDVYLTFDVVAACPRAQGPIKTLGSRHPSPSLPGPCRFAFCSALLCTCSHFLLLVSALLPSCSLYLFAFLAFLLHSYLTTKPVSSVPSVLPGPSQPCCSVVSFLWWSLYQELIFQTPDETFVLIVPECSSSFSKNVFFFNSNPVVFHHQGSLKQIEILSGFLKIIVGGA